MNKLYPNIFQSVYLNLTKLRAFYSREAAVRLHNLLIKMPKEPKHIPGVQKQRQKIKEKSHKYISGTVRLQVLGTGAEGAPRALYVFTDHSRYLFNCGEGTQRLAHEHKMKLSRLEHIFITQPVWSNIGGLPGLALTIQDVGVSNIDLHGPAGLDELFTATRRFVVLKDLQVTMANCDTNFEDSVMTVNYIKIVKTTTNNEQPENITTAPTDFQDKSPMQERTWKRPEVEDDTTDYYAQQKTAVQRTFPLIPNEYREQNTVMNYICKLRSRPGELCLEKCVQEGVPPGPLLGRLKNGEDVVLPNGTVVRSVDVCSPDDPGPVFMVVDCPSLDYIDSFLSNEEWSKYQSTAQEDANLALVVIHFTPPEIMKNIRYKEWIEKFSLSTQHICLNTESTCLGSASVFKVQNQLNLIDDIIFPPIHSPFGDKSSPKRIRLQPEEISSSMEPESYNIIPSKTLWTYHLRPKKGLDQSNEILDTLKEDIAEAVETEGFTDVLETLRKEKELVRTNPGLDPSILFLGTGSCIPNKTRNTSGILLKTSKDSYILLDCGEGTFGQLVRFFGRPAVIPILQQIKAIYVSHLHADHHIGLVGFLTGRRNLLKSVNLPCEAFFLYAPKQILWWLNMYNKRFENISKDFILVSNGSLNLDDHTCPEDYEKDMLEKIKLGKIDTVLVRHCPNAFGVAVQTLSGHKITYSGDTMPCQELVRLGMDSDLLIHEATMEDELELEAKIKMHSTTSQAIDIGKQMNAKFILLTHFSQRYARVPRIPDDIASNVGIAFDNMKVSLYDLKVLPLLNPALKILFHDHCELLETKAAKRQAREIRNKEAENKQKKRKSTESDDIGIIQNEKKLERMDL